MDSRERSASANLSYEEPSALDAHARVCGGRGAVTPSPTRPPDPRLGPLQSMWNHREGLEVFLTKPFVPMDKHVPGHISKSIFWSAGRQTDAGSERRRPLAAPVTKKWVGLNRRPMPCLWGLLGRQGLLGAPAAADAAREGRTGTPRGGQGALAEGPGEQRPTGRRRERGRERMRGRSCPGRSAGPAGRRERSGGACDGHDVSSGGGGSAAGSSVSITSMRPRRQAGHCHNGSPVSSS